MEIIVSHGVAAMAVIDSCAVKPIEKNLAITHHWWLQELAFLATFPQKFTALCVNCPLVIQCQQLCTSKFVSLNFTSKL